MRMFTVDERNVKGPFGVLVRAAVLTVFGITAGLPWPARAAATRTRVSLVNNQWYLNGKLTNPGTFAEGRLMNVRMVNAIFEDRARHPEFDPDANTDRFLALLDDYAAH